MQFKSIIIPQAPLRSSYNTKSIVETQCLFGETLQILEKRGNWSFCKCALDNYNGWIENKYLGFLPKSSHLVSSPVSLVFQKKNIKSNLLCNLFLNSKIAIKAIYEDWYEIFLNSNRTGFIKKQHVTAENIKQKNWVKTSLNFEKTPYLWGGKNILGLDCSGLVQVSLEAAGLIVPRNAGEQMRFKSNHIISTRNVQRGCLIFWPNHVAIALSSHRVIHSNSFHMCVKIENLKTVANRISSTDGDIIEIKQVQI